MSPITVYVSRPAAPLCERVCDFLSGEGYNYVTVEIKDDEARARLADQTGYTSCPLVVANGQVIGKLNETVEAARSGRLAAWRIEEDR